MKKVGVIIGRFQVPFLTDGHLNLFENVLKEVDELIVFIGVSHSNLSAHDPLSYEARYMMVSKTIIENFMPKKLITYFPLSDMKQHEMWSLNLDNKIAELTDKSDEVTLYGSRDCFIHGYTTKKYSFKEIPTKESLSGTQIRNQVATNFEHNHEFRKGVIYAVANKYPICYPTVDVAIYNLKGQWLLGRKRNQTEFRFIGGFADPEDDSYEHSAIREVKEETNLDINLFELDYVGSAKVNDWRYKNSENKIKTIFFKACALEYSDAKAMDDIIEIKWVSTKQLLEEELVSEHRVLRDMLQLNNQ